MRASLNIPGPLTEASLTAALAGLTAFNVEWLRAHPSAPSLYTSGVRYRREGKGSEDWQTFPDLLASGFGDCEDLAGALAAELIVSGEDPDARAIARRVREGLWHIQVERGDGTIEDPSRVLGMGASSSKGATTMAGTTAPGEFKGGYRMVRTKTGYRFELDLPFGMTATGTGKSEPDAMRSAAALAEQAMRNPAMQAILPPQAQLAIKSAAVLARSPAAREAWHALKKGKSLVKAAKKLNPFSW